MYLNVLKHIKLLTRGTYLSIRTSTSAGLDPQTKTWVGYYTCVVETSVATHHWSGRSVGCA